MTRTSSGTLVRTHTHTKLLLLSCSCSCRYGKNPLTPPSSPKLLGFGTDPKSEILTVELVEWLSEIHCLPVWRSLLSAAHSKSAEEGRNDKKYPTDEGDEVQMSEKKRPTVVKILVLIVAIGSIKPILAGVMLLTGGAFETYFMQELLRGIMPTVYVLAGVIGLVCAWGLWIGRGWAWIIAVILHIIGVIMGLVTLPTGIVGFVMDGIVVYLLMRPDTRKFCGK